ncbi:hypothetical protein COC43_08140 [Bacillus thuringiensis]|nr:hypothetical protein COC43_08140 [Bacillus thuringiensis]
MELLEKKVHVEQSHYIDSALFIFKKRRQKADKKGGILEMKITVNYTYKPFDNRISKRISTPISETFLCENVTVTYTA